MTVACGIELDPDGSQRRQLLDADVGAGMLIAVDDGVGLAAAAGDGDGHEFVGELTRLVRGDRAVVGAHRQFVLRFAGDVVLATKVLCRLDHAAGDGMRCAACGFTGTVESVEQGDAALAYSGAQSERVVLDVRHRLRSPGDDHAGRAGGNLTCGV